MPRWLPRVLKRIHAHAIAAEVRLTYKAAREVLALNFAPEDVLDVLACLGTEDSAGRRSSDTTGEWLYIFKPDVGGLRVYVKVLLREGCVVVSFHEDEGAGHEEAE